MKKVFRNSNELIAALKKEGARVLSQTEEFQKNPTLVLDDDLMKAAEDLRQTIMDNYRISHSKVSGKRGSAKGLIGKPEIDKGKMEIVMHFTDSGYRRNLFDTHDSFLPILLDYGWSVHGSKSPNNIFMHYEGDRFIRRAIENFNNKYGSRGMFATLEIDGVDYTKYSEANKIPYKKNEGE